jgi:hypothetical protein
MKFSIYNQFGARNSAPVFEAFAQGVKENGHSVEYHNDSADVAVIWSQLWAGRMAPNQQVWNQYRDSGRNVIILEVGAIARGVTWRVLLNGQQEFLTVGNDSSRAERLNLQVAPWKRNGTQIVIACQRADSNQWAGQPSLQEWLDITIGQIKQYSRKQIIIRPHPRYPLSYNAYGAEIVRGFKVAGTYDDYNFDEALSNAWAVVNWNSNPGVQSVIAGVPAFVGGSSLAAMVGNTSLAMIERPYRPDRTQWINDLAWTEWTVEEITQGLPISLLSKRM